MPREDEAVAEQRLRDPDDEIERARDHAEA
jgi:hypothetical protein